MKPTLGGSGPAIKLVHYGAAIQGAVRRNSYWTDFESTNKDDISRITGQPAIYFRFRTTVLVNRAKLNDYFRNVATAMKPGLPAADEYRNKDEVPSSYLESVPLP
jgi:hypothetical protein